MKASKTTNAKRLTVLTASLGLIALAAAPAGAACLKSDVPLPQSATGAAPLAPALFRPGTAASDAFWRVSDEEEAPTIVGLWQFKMTGIAADYGTQAWHSDGPEIIFSGAQNPATADVCQGVWRKIAPLTYTLNHIAMGWVAPGAGFGIRVHIHEVVKLDPTGNSLTGTYKATIYSVSPADPFDEGAPIASGGGNVSATRVKPD